MTGRDLARKSIVLLGATLPAFVATVRYLAVTVMASNPTAFELAPMVAGAEFVVVPARWVELNHDASHPGGCDGSVFGAGEISM